MNGVADPAKVGPTWVRWRIVVLLMALSYISWLLRVSMSVAYDEKIKDDLGITPQAMGYVYSALLLIYALCMTPGGWFIDRRGSRKALTVMGFGLAVFCALTGLVGFSSHLLPYLPAGVTLAALSLVLFLLIRSVMGVFAAPMYPASAQSIAHWLPFRQRGWANGLVQGSAALGIASTPLVVGSLISWVDWPQTFFLVAVATGLVAILWALYATDRPEQHPAVNAAERDLIAVDPVPSPEVVSSGLLARSRWRLLRNRSLVCLTLSYAAVGYFEYLFFFWMDYYFKDQLHLPDGVRRVYGGIIFLAMALGMMCGGRVSDRLVRNYGYRLGRAIVPVGGLLVGAIFLLLGVTVEQPAWIVVCFSIALGGVGSTEAPTWTTAQELGGRQGGTAAGICNTGGNAGGLLAPVLTPLIAEYFHWKVAIAVGSAVCLAGVVLWIWINPHERVVEN